MKTPSGHLTCSRSILKKGATLGALFYSLNLDSGLIQERYSPNKRTKYEYPTEKSQNVTY
jgi:hypothetical protein